MLRRRKKGRIPRSSFAGAIRLRPAGASGCGVGGRAATAIWLRLRGAHSSGCGWAPWRRARWSPARCVNVALTISVVPDSRARWARTRAHRPIRGARVMEGLRSPPPSGGKADATCELCSSVKTAAKDPDAAHGGRRGGSTEEQRSQTVGPSYEVHYNHPLYTHVRAFRMFGLRAFIHWHTRVNQVHSFIRTQVCTQASAHGRGGWVGVGGWVVE